MADKPELDLVAMNRRHAKRHLLRLADQAVRLAETLDRFADDLDKVGTAPGYASHSNIAGSAVHEVMTFLANAHFEQVTGYAADADAEAAVVSARDAKPTEGD
jgi:hypothetical protein